MTKKLGKISIYAANNWPTLGIGLNVLYYGPRAREGTLSDRNLFEMKFTTSLTIGPFVLQAFIPTEEYYK